MTCLVTGATGFIGSAVARALSLRGEQIRTLVRAGSDRTNLANLPIEVIEGDLTDEPSLRRAVAGCKAVYHVAAAYSHWVRDPVTMYKVNVAGTEALMAAARDAGVARVVHTSSVGALATDPSGAPADEDRPVTIDHIIGHYHRSKFLAERVVQRFAAEGLAVSIVNPTMPVGPRDIKPTPTGRTILEAAAGHIPAYVDTGVNIAHVDDVAEGHLLAHDKGRPGRCYILGGENMTLRGLLELVGWVANMDKRVLFRLPHLAVLPVAYISEAVAAVTGKEPLATLDEARLARHKMYFSSERAKTELGYRARPAADAVRDAVAWFQSHGHLQPRAPLKRAASGAADQVGDTTP
jgi:dihydroflavonol-4-reductase